MNAIANIVVADGIIEKHEFVALQEAIGLLQDKEEIHALMDRVKKKELIEHIVANRRRFYVNNLELG